MICEYCGKEFERGINAWTGKPHTNQKYCCVKCQRKDHYQKIRDNFLIYMREYQQKKRKHTECVVCGEPLPKYKRKFCSAKCKYIATGPRQNKYALHHIGDTKICPVCGKEFVFKGTSHTYCSQDCFIIAVRRRQRQRQHDRSFIHHHLGDTVKCKCCGADYILEFRSQKYCEDCRSKKKDYDNILIGYDDELNRCQLCGGIMRGNQYVICSECAKVSSFKYEPKVIYTGEVVDRIFPVGG